MEEKPFGAFAILYPYRPVEPQGLEPWSPLVRLHAFKQVDACRPLYSCKMQCLWVVVKECGLRTLRDRSRLSTVTHGLRGPSAAR